MIFQHWKYWKAICLKMNKFYLKNRVYIQLFVTLISIFIFYNIVTSSADSIESSDNNSPISETNVEIISVNIPQGSAAAEISSILDATGVITSKLAFELYLRNENLTDKLRAGTYELPNNLSFEDLTALLLKGPPLKTYTITIPEGLWISETLETLSAQTGYEVIQLENSLTSGQVVSKYLTQQQSQVLQNWEGLLFPNTYQIDIEANGEDILYNGMTGEQLETSIYIGPTYYERLKHMPKDKINYRARGPRTVLTRQTVGGRANDGGLRIGEMDRDCLIAHGMSHFINESMMIRGDQFYMAVCNNSGCIAIYNESKNIFLSPHADGPLKFSGDLETTANIIPISLSLIHI